MKILMTGSESYIGSVLGPLLRNRGFKVFGFDLKNGADICDERNIEGAVKHTDIIIHLAACSTPAICEKEPKLAKRVNVDAVEMINRFRGNKPIFYPNTNIGYGVQVKQEIYDETSPMHPNSVYGKTKCEGERLVLEAGNCVVFRLASLFGPSPSMRWNLLLNFMVKDAVEKGELNLYEPLVKRNFLHVNDICSAFMHAIANYSTMNGQVYNVGLSHHPTKLELARMIKIQLPNVKIEQDDGSDPDKRDYVISNSKLLATGWRPQITIPAGIKELIEVLRG